jgi:hypothetical protein
MFQGNFYIVTLSTIAATELESVETKPYVS